jgi:hypothetical protein
MGGMRSREIQLQRNKKLKEILTPDKRIYEACEALRQFVEHPNDRSDIILNQGIYRAKDPEAIQVVKVDGVEIGYKVKPCSLLEINPYFDRYVYYKVTGYRLTDLSHKEMDSIKTTIYDVFFEPQQGEIHIDVISYDAMLLWQRFAVVFLHNKNPNLQSISGGVNLGEGGLIQ